MAGFVYEVGLVAVAELDDWDALHAVEAVIARDLALEEYLRYREERGDRNPVRITDYVERVVPIYSDVEFKSHFRMQRTTYEDLHRLLTPHLHDKIVDVDKKLLATLWLLGNEDSFRGVGDRFGLSKSSLHLVFMEVCESLKIVHDGIIVWPHDHIHSVVEGFQNKSNFPGIIGAVDGTYIEIPGLQPFRASYVNRMGFPSIQLQAVCDSHLRFMDIHTGWPGSVHDARVFKNSPLQTLLENGNLPDNYHLLGDSAYTLAPYMIVPFRDNGHLTDVQKNFNVRHSSARVVIERAFGLLKCKFRRLRYLHMTSIEKIPLVISAACVLHNFILLKEKIDIRDLEALEVEAYPAIPDPEAPPAQAAANVAAQRKRNELARMLA